MRKIVSKVFFFFSSGSPSTAADSFQDSIFCS